MPFPTDPVEAVRLYRGLGFGIHPLTGPTEGGGHEQGKKPRFRKERWGKLTEDEVPKFFGNCQRPSNLGCLLEGYQVVVDLDCKSGHAGADAWLVKHPELAAVPREKTSRGYHLHFWCPDLPIFRKENGKKLMRPLVKELEPGLNAEMFFDGLNVTMAPSIHRSGHHYAWEVAGKIPTVTWVDLQRIFGFCDPQEEKGGSPKMPRGRPTKEVPWQAKFSGDLSTVNIVALFKKFALYSGLLSEDEGKHAVTCPWISEHSGGGGDNGATDSGTVIFTEKENSWPGFKCLHAHCSARGLQQALEYFEARESGCVDGHCVRMRVWKDGQTSKDGRPRIILPGPDYPQSGFADEIGRVLGPTQSWFRFGTEIVALDRVDEKDRSAALVGLAFHAVKPAEFVTSVECNIEVGKVVSDPNFGTEFVPLSMNEQAAKITLASGQLRFRLPLILRILDVSLPVLLDGKIVYPSAGYDARFNTYLDSGAPQIRSMAMDEAKTLILGEILAIEAEGGFCWKNEQSRVHAVARMLTSFCRGLMGWAKGPLWIYEANRERCGKDYLANAHFVVFIGRRIVSAPIESTAGEEMRKRITTCLMAGARYIHFANMKGHVRFAALEAATDNSGVWEDRVLGSNTQTQLPNEAEYSFSANTGTTWEPDIDQRSRRISLHFTAENVNGRRFRHMDLHNFVLARRADILSALACFVDNWDRQGRPDGPTPFASFPEWARIVGGVMVAAGLGDPCLPHSDQSAISGDQTTEDMKALFVLAHQSFGERFVAKQEIYDLLSGKSGEGLFPYVDLGERAGQTTMGKLLHKFEDRELGGISLQIQQTNKNNGRFRFVQTPKTGTSGTSGTFLSPRGGSPENATEKTQDPSCSEKGSLMASHTDGGGKVPDVPDVPAPTPAGVTGPGSHVNDRGQLGIIAEAITASSGTVALDIETYGAGKGDAINPFRGDIRLLTLSIPGHAPWIIDLKAIGYDLDPLKGALEAKGVTAHNAKFDLLWLRVKCGLNLRRVFCTLTAARLLTAGEKPGNNLDQCLERYLKIPPSRDQSRSDWGTMFLTDDQIAYASRDVEHLHVLRTTMEKEIGAAKLEEVATLEMSLLPVVVDMEFAGIGVDRERLEKVRDGARAEVEARLRDLRAVLDAPTLNPNSPKQLLEAFAVAGIRLPDTKESTLVSCGDTRAVPHLLKFRGAEKQVQQATGLLDCITLDGRIHGQFNPMGTATGRFSGKEPNLQNIARGPIRETFVAPDGHCLVVADYSQVELRIAAVLTGDEKMLTAFRKSEDLHRATAAAVLGKDVSAVTKEDRQLAKAVNFGLLYGQGAPGLVRYAKGSYGVELSEPEAARIRDRFFEVYAGLKRWHQKTWELVRGRAKEVRTITGRRRLIPADAKDWNRFTDLVNSPVQGGGADGMKRAMVSLAGRLPAGARMVSTVHDELLVEAPEADAETVKNIVTTTMREAMEGLFPGVPIEVEAKVCRSWGEK